MLQTSKAEKSMFMSRHLKVGWTRCKGDATKRTREVG